MIQGQARERSGKVAPANSVSFEAFIAHSSLRLGDPRKRPIQLQNRSTALEESPTSAFRHGINKPVPLRPTISPTLASLFARACLNRREICTMYPWLVSHPPRPSPWVAHVSTIEKPKINSRNGSQQTNHQSSQTLKLLLIDFFDAAIIIFSERLLLRHRHRPARTEGEHEAMVLFREFQES